MALEFRRLLNGIVIINVIDTIHYSSYINYQNSFFSYLRRIRIYVQRDEPVKWNSDWSTIRWTA